MIDNDKWNDYTFVRLSDATLPLLVPLFKDAMGLDISIENIRHKFDTEAFFGVKNIAHLALDEMGNAAAFYILFPSFIRVSGRTVLAGQVGDLMTHSKHQRKGLFIKLGLLTHQLAKENGFEQVYTFLYGQNAPYFGFQKHLGFTGEPVNSYQLTVNTLPLCRLMNKWKVTASFYSIFLKALNLLAFPGSTLFHGVNTTHNVVKKDALFFKYKFTYSNSRIIKLGKNAAWIKISPNGYVSVGDFENYQTIERTIRRLRLYCILAGIRAIRMEFSQNHPLVNRLNNIVRPKNEFYLCRLNLNGNVADSNSIAYSFGDMDNF